jgi:hypothetical protein
LFLAEFIPVIAVAGLAACPLAYVVMQRWLAHYAARIAVTPLPFIASVVGLGVLTLLLIGLQTIRAARANPVASLRSE